MAVLVWSYPEGPMLGTRYVVADAGITVIGRAEDCDVRIQEMSVSRHHARLYYTPDGWHLEDLSSLNGTGVELFPVDGIAHVRDSDVIRIGGIWLRLIEHTSPVPSGSDGGGRPSAVVAIDDRDKN